MADAVATQELMVGVPYRRITHLRKHLALEFLDAGHILGSASVDLRITEPGSHRLVFSGDIGRTGLPIIRDPEPPSGPIDTLIVESTYADRSHESVAEAEEQLGEAVRRVAARGGKMLVPAFAAGPLPGAGLQPPPALAGEEDPRDPDLRGQPARGGHHHGVPDAPRGLRPAGAPGHRREPASSTSRWSATSARSRTPRRSNGANGPAIIIAASGMAESGRILHHLAHGIGDHRNLVLFVGFQAEHTLGRRIQEGADPVRIFGEEYPVRAEVETIGGYSAHADRSELRAWVRRLGGPIRRAFVVHGEPGPLEAMAKLLREEGVRDVRVPQHGETFEL